jgi:Leishmanolysin
VWLPDKSIMLRAVSTSKASHGVVGLLGLVMLGCGASDSSVAPPPPPTLIPPHLTIDVRYISTFSPEQKFTIATAADKWTHALLTDLGNFRLSFAHNDCFLGEPAVNELHHNVLLFLSREPVDGPHGTLAYTQVCSQSTRDLPIVSHIRIDAADIDSLEIRGLLASVVMHEMGHALGFNPQVWGRKGLVGGGTADPYFTGLSARTEFVRSVPSYMGNAVPLDDSDLQGEQSSHWRWSVFGDELMVGALVPGYHYPLSSVTLGLFKDIGYDVDMNAAEPYPALSIMSGPPGTVRTMLDGDVVAPMVRRVLRRIATP